MDCLLLPGVSAGLDVEPKQHVGFSPDPLHFDRPEAEALGFGPDLGDMGFAALGAHVDLRAAGEVDAKIHADEQEHQHGDD